MSSAAPASAVAGFGDVEAGKFYTEAIQWMVNQKITTGTAPGCFEPTSQTTRGEVATFVHRLQGEPATGSEPFTDVSDTDFFAEAVAWMFSEGITTGTSDTTFHPDRALTRGELATFLHRLAGTPAPGSEPFTDVSDTDFFADAVAWMFNEKITTGTSDTTFHPHRPLTRGEVATFLHRYSGSPKVEVSSDGLCSTDVDALLQEAEAHSLRLLNELRAQHGLHPLVIDPQLDADARDWSYTMYVDWANDADRWFRHSSLPWGENIVWWSNGSWDPERIAEKFHNMWVNSPGHFRNMTDENYQFIGVGFWQDDQGGWFGTHEFSRWAP